MKRITTKNDLKNDNKENKRRKMRAQYFSASRDSLFLADIIEIEQAFRKADDETMRLIEAEC
jgi:hypothetical protein